MNATLVFDLVSPARTAMINDPCGLRLANEKLYALQLPDLVPATIVSARRESIREVVAIHGEAVSKPNDGYAGRGVVRLGAEDPNLPSLTAMLTGNHQICARLAPALVRAGLRMVGLDVIGRYLIEVNVSSPGALKKADTLLGWSLCRDLVDHFLVGGVRRIE